MREGGGYVARRSDAAACRRLHRAVDEDAFRADRQTAETKIGNHTTTRASTRTTQLYGRRSDEVSLDEWGGW
jgi:hypothetical protein